MEKRTVAAFEDDIHQGFLYVHPLDDRHALAAVEIVSLLSRHHLRSLDALHLAIARDLDTPLIATADRVMAAAAEAMGFSVVRFD